MVTHMKTTIDLADDLLLRAKDRAARDSITLRALIERSLAAALDEQGMTATVKPVIFGGKGLSPDFEGASWETIREAIYR